MASIAASMPATLGMMETGVTRAFLPSLVLTATDTGTLFVLPSNEKGLGTKALGFHANPTTSPP